MGNRKTAHHTTWQRAHTFPRAPSLREEKTTLSQADLIVVGGEMVSTPHGYTGASHFNQFCQGSAHMSMDLHTAMSSVAGLMTMAKSAIEARDWTKLAEMSTKFNEQIIKTQQAVIDAQAAQSDLVTKLSEANQKIRELETALAQQNSHVLEEIVPGKFALRVQHAGENESDLMLNSNRKPKRYACQRCFALTGKSFILQFTAQTEWTPNTYACTNCDVRLHY